MRAQAFIFPLTLFILFFVAALSQATFVNQIEHSNFLAQEEKYLADMQRNNRLEENTISNLANPWAEVEKRSLVLDGVYNLNHLVDTTALNQRKINYEQIEILRRILALCELDTSYADKIADFLSGQPSPDSAFSVIDLISIMNIPINNFSKIATCVRFASPLRKLNLSYMPVQKIMAILDITFVSAQSIKNQLSNKTIKSKSELLDYLKRELGFRNWEDYLEHISVSQKHNHKAVYWVNKGETFALYDLVLEAENSWSVNWSVIIWLPGAIK